ncbi:cell filamentation protein Fic [Chitinophaga caeni]|uniref:Cell filamentation protein Fic n=1 Tax=Chitinophaga caeni TaxID=2029983 RepID=A0A291QPL8_9BACT|nr:Fic family protein [Chitinophaga caeni]ATL45900.1 cell filamentation protein Fic [Chitinophaga caeni]
MRLPERPPLIPKGFDFTKLLTTLAQIGRIDEFNFIASDKYYYYDKWKYRAKEWGIDPKLLWGAVKIYRRFSNKKMAIGGLRELEFFISFPSLVQEYLHEFDMNLGGSLQGEMIIPREDRDRYLISSLMEEAIASSQLEGAATTRKVAKQMLESNRKPKNQAEQMIVNNYNAMQWIVRNKEIPITLSNIKHLHAILTKSTMADVNEEGAFRTDDDVKVVDVQTGTAIYTPPKAEDLDRLMAAFCDFANDRETYGFFLHPIVKAIIIHFLVGYIHPFADGNGRTARTIFYWYLLKHGYWLIEFMSVSRIILSSKAQYSRAYLHTEQDDNDLTYFLNYNLKCIRLALVDLKLYIKKKSEEKQHAMSMLRSTTLNERQIVLVQEVLRTPTAYFTVKQVEIKFGISNQTARNDLNGLVNEGLFEERRLGKKSQYLPVKEFEKKIVS